MPGGQPVTTYPGITESELADEDPGLTDLGPDEAMHKTTVGLGVSFHHGSCHWGIHIEVYGHDQVSTLPPS